MVVVISSVKSNPCMAIAMAVNNGDANNVDVDKRIYKYLIS